MIGEKEGRILAASYQEELKKLRKRGRNRPKDKKKKLKALFRARKGRG